MYNCMFCVPIWEVMKRLNLLCSCLGCVILLFWVGLDDLAWDFPAPFTNLSMHGQIGAWMGRSADFPDGMGPCTSEGLGSRTEQRRVHPSCSACAVCNPFSLFRFFS